MIPNRKVYTVGSIILASIINIPCNSQSQIEFRISPASVLSLSGESSVTGFSCELRNNFTNTRQLITAEVKDDMLKLDGAEIEIIIENFDCANARMERDLQDAMKANQFPSMTLRIMEFNYTGGIDEILESKCTTGLVEITLANISQCVFLNFNDIELSDNLLSISGTKEIDMREFDIIPPQVLLGLVKVDEIIVIKFDLKVMLSL